MHRSLFVVLCLTAANFIAIGCGGADRPALVEVTGQVTLNGQPLSGAAVSLQLDPPDPAYRRPSRGMTDGSGNFSPSMYGDAKGLPPGKYKVAVIKQEVPEEFNSENPAATAVNITWITPKFYSEMETSGLTVEVTSSGMVPPVLALESSGKPEVENTRVKRPSNEP